MTKEDSQKEDKKTYRQWCFCNPETVNKDIYQLRRSVYCESSIYLCSCGRCLVVNIVGRQIHYMHAIKHVGEISSSCKGSGNKSEQFIHIQTNTQV